MKVFCLFLFLSLPGIIFSQQVADTTFNPKISIPEYKRGEGSVVFIDEGHYNFHTKSGRYKAFATLLERDGYNVQEYRGEFKKDNLEKGKILVISNALNIINEQNWFLPTPSAFTESEINSVQQWVFNGGSLFLIADHMPMAGAASDFAKAFGFEFTNGFVMDTISGGPAFFRRDNNTLSGNSITNGRNDNERVEQVASFTGQGFKIPTDATSILTFREKYVNLLPDTAWVFDENTVIFNAGGLSQGAFKKYGKGRVVVFGEAAMFTAQLAGPNKIKMGMNNEVAPENYKLLLNIIHWLDEKLDKD